MTRSQEQQVTTVDVPSIKAQVADPGVRLVEVDVSLAAYDQGHIPGAIIWKPTPTCAIRPTGQFHQRSCNAFSRARASARIRPLSCMAMRPRSASGS